MLLSKYKFQKLTVNSLKAGLVKLLFPLIVKHNDYRSFNYPIPLPKLIKESLVSKSQLKKSAFNPSSFLRCFKDSENSFMASSFIKGVFSLILALTNNYFKFQFDRKAKKQSVIFFISILLQSSKFIENSVVLATNLLQNFSSRDSLIK